MAKKNLEDYRQAFMHLLAEAEMTLGCPLSAQVWSDTKVPLYSGGTVIEKSYHCAIRTTEDDG